jgi:alpha-glucosidase
LTAPGVGFGPADGAAPWLPQPPEWRQLAAAAQAGDSGSMLALYRGALRARAARDCLDDDSLTWLTAPDGVLAFSRPGRFACVINISAAPVPLPDDADVLLASGTLDDGKLPPDTAVWLRTGGGSGADGQSTSAW